MAQRSVGTKAKNQHSIHGQSMVEIALLLPVLLMLVLGALDLGRAFYYASAVANATRVGGQYALDPKTSQADIKQVIIAEAIPYLTLDPARITFTPANSGSWTPGVEYTVSVTYDFHFLIPLAKAFWGDPVTMRHISVLRFE